MCYDVNPLTMKLHLHELDRQAGLIRLSRSNSLLMPRKTWRALVSTVQRIRDRFSGEDRALGRIRAAVHRKADVVHG